MFRRALTGAADSAALAYFRVVFGLTVAWEAGRYLASDWIARSYVEPGFHFTYWPLDAVVPWSEPFMTLLFWLIGAAGLCLAVGWFTRVAAITMFTAFTWMFLIDQARYLDHYYLIALLSFLTVFLPVDRVFALDVLRRPQRASDTVPAWTLGLLRFQLAVPYVFGGIGKIDADWLAGEPLRTWLAPYVGLPGVGGLVVHPSLVQAFAWGGILGDLLLVPLLLFRPTRVVGLAWMMATHLVASRGIGGGTFPWMMILVTLVFLPSDWTRRLWHDVRRLRPVPLLSVAVFGWVGFVYGNLVPAQPSAMNAVIAAFSLGVLGWELARWGWDAVPRGGEPEHRPLAPAMAWAAVWMLVQIVVPLRPFAIPGDVSWTEEGQHWSWRMNVRDKRVDRLVITVHTPGREPVPIGQDHDRLTNQQWSALATTPDMLVQYAHHLKAQASDPAARVTVESWVSLNQRPPRLLLDPERDIASIPRPWPMPGDFIEPLDTPQPTREGTVRW